ncbi:Glycine oxidase [bacterium HR33]|nr:Glycine oxidase [bacterium HR33]
MSANPDLIIVGAGAIGTACARALASRGVSVLLVEAGPKPGAATPASAGMLAPLVETNRDDPMLALCVRARDLYRELAPALRDETGIDIGLWTSGILTVAFSEEELEQLKEEVAWQRQQGYHAEWLTPEEIKERHPGIYPAILGGVLAAEDGALDPLALNEAMLRSAMARGANLLQGERVDELVIRDGRLTAVRTATRTISAGAAVIAAGCWSGRISGLPRPLSVEPVRGQLVALDWPAGEPPGIVYAGQGYLLKRGNEAIAGTTVEHVGFDPGVTEAGIASILATARKVFPALAGKPVLRQWAGLRPGTPDGRPMVGRDPEIPNLWYATGHGRHGILLAALTGEIIANLFAGEKQEYDLSPLDPSRFWSQ